MRGLLYLLFAIVNDSIFVSSYFCNHKLKEKTSCLLLLKLSNFPPLLFLVFAITKYYGVDRTLHNLMKCNLYHNLGPTAFNWRKNLEFTPLLDSASFDTLCLLEATPTIMFHYQSYTSLHPVTERKVGYKRYKARSRGRSSPDTLAF